MKPIVLSSSAKKRPAVLIGTPSHDMRVTVGYTTSVTNLMIKKPYVMRLFVMGKSGITKARNHCAYHFLNMFEGGTHLLFWDSDIIPPDAEQAVKALVERDVPVVGWLYAHKSPNLRWCLNVVTPEGATEDTEVEPITTGKLAGLLPVKTLGTGGMCVRRDVFETLIEKFGDELEYIEDQEGDGEATPKGTKSYAFFQERIVDRRLLTEDWFFCKLCERAGIPMYVDVRFHVEHEGIIAYPLNPDYKTQALPAPEPAAELAGAPAAK